MNSRARTATIVPSRQSYRPVTASRWATTLVLHSVVAAIAVATVFPFLWMVSSSFKPNSELFRFPPSLLPNKWYLDNFVRAWEAARFSRYFGNSVVVAVTGTLLTLGVCAMAAYAFCKLEFKGREALFWVVLGSQMVPGIVTLIPSFLVVRAMPLVGGNDLLGRGGHGLLNSYAGLIVPGAGGAFGVFLLRQFFSTIPEELLDAARMDGCSELGIFALIVMPLAKPALAALSIFTFQGYWNDFIWPLVITSQDGCRTIQLGLMVFRQRFSTDWGALMAGLHVLIGYVGVMVLWRNHYIGDAWAMTDIAPLIVRQLTAS